MTLCIDRERCQGCNGHPRCADVCPGNLLVLGEQGQIASREPDDCWDCAACVKVCPRQALSLTLPPEVGGRGSRLWARQVGGKMHWTIVDGQGRTKNFVI
ncbi:4Fe-4S dicluster domain-containing protein [Heliophilum fasciatum]|uniref:Dissimilatory adenylylsulfate reductase beta subunit n=1 Tax=Heliophilum fasciatum TaxID=35700 RepID=A0A4R2RWB3_9FIRM|nr:4Fe-4S dicluster domain-containing protein [Heliophilum fasciatum]MCW2276797.1 adenylylsulfate reductase subunit B [Heliophilum fasciatum]TCP68742.1 dissimilatory adenylylsulfate reductase beta subunit [Heliophilum fasciatum]